MSTDKNSQRKKAKTASTSSRTTWWPNYDVVIHTSYQSYSTARVWTRTILSYASGLMQAQYSRWDMSSTSRVEVVVVCCCTGKGAAFRDGAEENLWKGNKIRINETDRIMLSQLLRRLQKKSCSARNRPATTRITRSFILVEWSVPRSSGHFHEFVWKINRMQENIVRF